MKRKKRDWKNRDKKNRLKRESNGRNRWKFLKIKTKVETMR